LQTLQKGEPKIKEIFDSQRNILRSELDPTRQRYEALLEQLNVSKDQETDLAQGGANRELGRRGIVSDSGIYDSEMNRVLSPIVRAYANQAKQLGLEGESALRHIQNGISALASQEAQALLGLNSEIGQMQFAGGQNAASLAMQILNAHQSQSQFDATLTAQQVQQQIANQLAQAELDLSTRKFEEYDLPNLLNTISKSKAASGSSVKASDVIATLKQATGQAKPTDAFSWSNFGLEPTAGASASLNTKPYTGF
jgi:hypothetical protein